MNTLSMSLSKLEEDDEDDESEVESEIYESLRNNSRRQYGSKGELGTTAMSNSLRSRKANKNNIEYFFEGSSVIDEATGTFDDGEESKADS